jgi:hypothetical protein
VTRFPQQAHQFVLFAHGRTAQDAQDGLAAVRVVGVGVHKISQSVNKNAQPVNRSG